eukprot:TRINITY_DN22701_c0_g1_i1.p2 TRINITY_DN22701_c0_g1~~TRINITY_DN22701_c0_g1_i1.p2  ORF type:complete len:276 (+),score=58.29 TRINITY_DN22701_c0_g1_i1:68-829(+)
MALRQLRRAQGPVSRTVAPARRGCDGPLRTFGSGAFSAPDDAIAAAIAAKPWPSWLCSEMRSNWAGEVGAVSIYRGCEAALERVSCPAERDALGSFAAEHKVSEEAHLRAMAALVPSASERSWMPAASFGYCLGYGSVLARGARGMYVTTHAVESFVEEHYGDQITRLRAELKAGEREPSEGYTRLLEILEGACADEVQHKQEAAERAAGAELNPGSASNTAPAAAAYTAVDRFHFAFVYWGSRVGAAIAKRI